MAAEEVGRGSQQQKRWSSGLFDCAKDPKTCCLVACCPCVAFAQNARRIMRNSPDPGCLLFCIYYFCLGACLACPLCCLIGPPAYWTCCVPCYAYRYRQCLRAKYGLPEEPLTDFCAHCCCHPCAVCQEARELAYQESLVGVSPLDRGPYSGASYGYAWPVLPPAVVVEAVPVPVPIPPPNMAMHRDWPEAGLERAPASTADQPARLKDAASEAKGSSS
eukprot:SM000185S04033  [mRNA]  locus=s185:15121:16104:+ [translate_table: standard]